MNKKVLVTKKIPDVGIKMLEDAGFSIDVLSGDYMLSQEEIILNLQKTSYDALLPLLTDKIDQKIFDAGPTIKIVANYATGYNNVDVEEAKKRGVTVTNTPGVSSLSVAEHTIALMLSMTTRLVEGDKYVVAGKFNGWSPTTLVGTDFSGKTIGLVGVGNIGGRVAHMAHHGFDAKIIYYDVARNEQVESDCKAEKMESVEDLLKISDIVSLHVPLLDSTHHLINEARLKIMKPTAFLVNTSRGPVVDEKALVEALQNKTIAGAALDVFEFEPKLTAGLTELSNIVLTPHIASARESARNDMAVLAAQAIIDFFDGKIPKNKVA